MANREPTIEDVYGGLPSWAAILLAVSAFILCVLIGIQKSDETETAEKKNIKQERTK